MIIQAIDNCDLPHLNVIALATDFIGILIGGIVSLLIFTEQMSIGHTEIQLNKGKKPISYVDISDVDKGPKKRNNAMKKVTSSASLVVQELPQSPPQTEEFGDTLVYRVTGQLTYVNSLAHVKRVKKIAKTQKELKNIVLALRYLWYADLDGVDALEEIVQYLETYNIKVYFSGVVHETVINALERHPFYQVLSFWAGIFLR